MFITSNVDLVRRDTITHIRRADEAEEEAAAAETDHEERGARTATHLREDVEQRGVHRADDRELRAHAQRDEHHEEHDSPQRRHRKTRHDLGIHDESQASTCTKITIY